jgi:hypothetical protein
MSRRESYLPYPGGELDSPRIIAGGQNANAPGPDDCQRISAFCPRSHRTIAKAHPELIAAFMQASAIDLGTAVIARAIDSLTDAVGNAASVIGESE